ncbi:MAG: beta-ketoacyl-ACP synthase [Opitutales bacterium]|nr:beta-ketoacyl-ACP synthase [Opitutales bacterium]
MNRRVVVTGMGALSPLGNSVKENFDRLHIYENAVEVLESLKEYSGLNSNLASVIKDFKIPERYSRKTLRTMGPVSVMSLFTAEQALEQAGIEQGGELIRGGRLGVAYGSSSGSVEPLLDFYSMVNTKVVRNITSSTYMKMMPQTTAVNISLYLKTTGRIIPSGTACTSGSLSIGYAYEAIKYGLQDVMIAGGAEEFSPTQVAIFDTLYATSSKNGSPKETPSPYDAERDGLVIGEGAATLILEEYEHAKARGAKIIAEIAGFASNTDGTHMTQPNARTIQAAIEKSMENAGVDSSEICYVNGHGTATAQGDIAETIATAAAFKRPVPISSMKSYIGHSLGACGAIEAAMTIEMLNSDWYMPTLNLKNVDSACGELDYIANEGRIMSGEYAMSNNFAFGGVNTSLIFKRL